MPESTFAAEEVEGPAAAELVKEEPSESEWDSLVEEDFDLKENSLLLMKTQRIYSDHVRTKIKEGTVRA